MTTEHYKFSCEKCKKEYSLEELPSFYGGCRHISSQAAFCFYIKCRVCETFQHIYIHDEYCFANFSDFLEKSYKINKKVLVEIKSLESNDPFQVLHKNPILYIINYAVPLTPEIIYYADDCAQKISDINKKKQELILYLHEQDQQEEIFNLHLQDRQEEIFYLQEQDNIYQESPDNLNSNQQQVLIQQQPAQKQTVQQQTVQQFLTAIKSINKNKSGIDRSYELIECLEMLFDVSGPIVDICLGKMKNEFKFTDRDIQTYKKELNRKKKEFEKTQKEEEFKKEIDQYIKEPKVLTEEEKAAATKYLQNPNIISNISRDIAHAGELVGEEINKMMLYFASISRKFDNPISIVIFGQSSSGKSYLANTIEKFIPPEDTLTLSSASQRAFEYMRDRLKHKSILIQELDGAEQILPTIRTLQSEGKLSRATVIQNPNDGSRQAIADSFECPCSVIITTTQAQINDENSTRIFELYTDESLEKIRNVVDMNFRNANIETRVDKKEKENIIELHQNVQRCLEKITVSIPFSNLLSFPKQSARNQRDSKRFLQLIKVVAFIRQKQKEVKCLNGVQYIEADLFDYKIAYIYGIQVLKNTLNTISEREQKVLIACCSLADELGKEKFFSVKQIILKGTALNLDFSNSSNIYKLMNKLNEYGYIERLKEPQSKNIYYRVSFDYLKNEKGQIINIDSPDIKEITTPEQLRIKMGLPQNNYVEIYN